jgi:LysM repeat protein
MNRLRLNPAALASFDARRAGSFIFSSSRPSHPWWLTLAVLVLGTAAPVHGQSTRALKEEVSRLSTNDRTQDIRLHHLERDVDLLQRKASYTPRPPSSSSPTTSGKSGKETVNVTPTSSTYTVKPGDTLWRIAMTHRVSPGEIMQHNKMSSDSVKTGQKLAIPGKSVTTYTPPAPTPTVQKTPAKTTPPGRNQYLVAPGDTFSQIASRHKISQAALQQANPGVNPNVIVIGSSLNIPASAAPPPTSPPPPEQAAPPSQAIAGSTGKHTVRPGDTLSSVAASYGVSLTALQNANKGVDPTRLQLGQSLNLPSGANPAPSPPKPETQVVNATPPPAPTPPAPPPSQALAPVSPPPAMSPMPQANPRGVLQYRVDSTDTLESIARTFTTTPDLIRELNGMSAGVKIKANDEIYVPAMGAVAP